MTIPKGPNNSLQLSCGSKHFITVILWAKHFATIILWVKTLHSSYFVGPNISLQLDWSNSIPMVQTFHYSYFTVNIRVNITLE